MNFTKEEREAYEARLKWLRMEASAIKKHKEDAKAEGRVERNIEIAKAMLLKNIDINTIHEITALSLEEINWLKSK